MCVCAWMWRCDGHGRVDISNPPNPLNILIDCDLFGSCQRDAYPVRRRSSLDLHFDTAIEAARGGVCFRTHSPARYYVRARFPNVISWKIPVLALLSSYPPRSPHRSDRDRLHLDSRKSFGGDIRWCRRHTNELSTHIPLFSHAKAHPVTSYARIHAQQAP